MERPLTQNDIKDFFESSISGKKELMGDNNTLRAIFGNWWPWNYYHRHVKIDFSEFLSIMTSDPISDHEMKVIFDEFDLNHDGEITFRGKFSSHTESAFQHAKTAILFMSI